MHILQADPCFVERAKNQQRLLYKFNPRYRWFSACERAVFAAEEATQILAVSMTEKPNFQHWYGTQSERFHYIPPFLSPERFVRENKKAMRKFLRAEFAFAANDFCLYADGLRFCHEGIRPCHFSHGSTTQRLIGNDKIGCRGTR